MTFVYSTKSLLYVALILSLEVPSSFWGCQSKAEVCICRPIFKRAVLFCACTASLLQVYRFLRLWVILLGIVTKCLFFQNAPLSLPLTKVSSSCVSKTWDQYDKTMYHDNDACFCSVVLLTEIKTFGDQSVWQKAKSPGRVQCGIDY